MGRHAKFQLLVVNAGRLERFAIRVQPILVVAVVGVVRGDGDAPMAQ